MMWRCPSCGNIADLNVPKGERLFCGPCRVQMVVTTAPTLNEMLESTADMGIEVADATDSGFTFIDPEEAN